MRPLLETHFPKAFNFIKQFQLSLPIIQAPMAGADNNQLAITIAQHGSLGSRGMGYNAAQSIASDIDELKSNSNFFNINLFIPDTRTTIEINDPFFQNKVNALKTFLKNNVDGLEFDLDKVAIFNPEQRFLEQMEVILDKTVPVLSTTFGALPPHFIKVCQQKNIYLIGTTTTVAEGKQFQSLGYDAIVAQGLEAGGHRGGSNARDLTREMDTISLTKALAEVVDIPIIASGGIRDGRKFIECLNAGASAVQIGTAFLGCSDCYSIPQAYKKLLLNNDKDTEITSAISGRNARGIKNSLFNIMTQYQHFYPKEELPYPFPHLITAPLRIEAAKVNNGDFIAAWSGISDVALQPLSINDFLTNMMNQAQEVIENKLKTCSVNKKR